MNFLFFSKLVLQSFITNQVYKGKNLLGIFKLEDGTDVIYWSWIDTYLIITEERHPDQRFSWYSLTMTHIELSHCFDSTVLPNDLLDLSTFLFYYYKPIFYLRKLNSNKTPFTIQWPIIKSFKFTQITFHLNLNHHVQNHRISPQKKSRTQRRSPHHSRISISYLIQRSPCINKKSKKYKISMCSAVTSKFCTCKITSSKKWKISTNSRNSSTSTSLSITFRKSKTFKDAKAWENSIWLSTLLMSWISMTVSLACPNYPISKNSISQETLVKDGKAAKIMSLQMYQLFSATMVKSSLLHKKFRLYSFFLHFKNPFTKPLNLESLN